MKRVLHKLNMVQRKQEDFKRRQSTVRDDVLRERFPWVLKNNSLGNYFLGGVTQEANYKKGVIVFLHQHRTAGSAMSQCLEEIAKNSSMAISDVVDSETRKEWDRNDRHYEHSERYKIHRGEFSFGMCDDFKKPCSYFSILRDPFERAQSSYQHCKSSLGDPLCQAVNANKVTLREWIIYNGSPLLRHLVYKSDICDDIENDEIVQNITDPNLVNKNSIPCWYVHKLKMDQLLPAEVNHLTDFVVENLKQWFSMVGLYEEFEDSISMLEKIYKLPFTKCKSLKKINKNDISNNSNTRHRISEYYDDNDPEYLEYDYDVNRVLEPDRKIYEKAKKIFNIQRQLHSNRLKR